MTSFLDRLEQQSRREWAHATALLERTASHGPSPNTQKSRPLSGTVFELKTRLGVRIPYFYDEGRVIICTEMLLKPKKIELSRVVARAKRDRERYFAAKRLQSITITQEKT